LSLPPPLRYVPIDALGAQAHIVVDGGARPATTLTLSHWPAAPTPPALARDLSAEIVFAYLDSPEHWVDGVQPVTNDHLDKDGLVSIFALVDPPAARSQAAMLIEIARIGDFDIVRDRRAATIAFALSALADPRRSPFAAAGGPGRDWTSTAYRALIQRLPLLLEAPEHGEELAADELARFDAGVAAIASGAVALEERPDSDLVVVTLNCPTRADEAGDLPEDFGLHPAAVHSATDAVRVLLVAGHRYRYYDRYETWVRYVSRRLPRRRDLRGLARRLGEGERAGTWIADAPGALHPRLGLSGGGQSSRPAHEIVELIETFLAEAPAAWDPWSPTGPLVEPVVSGREGPRGGTSGRGRSRWRGPGRGRRAI
jgi:hypothetical protein